MGSSNPSCGARYTPTESVTAETSRRGAGNGESIDLRLATLGAGLGRVYTTGRRGARDILGLRAYLGTKPDAALKGKSD
jgi:hypothetical protein